MKIYCTECQTEKDESEFYKRFVTNNEHPVIEQGVNIATINDSQGICKECLIEKFTYTYKLFNNNFEQALRAMCEDYNLPFVTNLINKYTNRNFIERLKFYIKDITSLPQYKNLTYFVKKEKSDIDFVNDDIRELKVKISKSLEKEDFNAHNKWMNSLRDALELRDRLENNNKWEDMYSHYYEGREVEKGDNEYVATWKQNYVGDIRNHKIYKVEKEVPTIRIEIDENYIIDGDTLTIPIKVNDKSSCAIKGKKVDDKWVLESGTTIKCS